MPRLSDRLAALLLGEGPLRFDRFQEMALYDPQEGYYARSGRVGREGDFVTGASWHPAFARCLARVAAALADEVGERVAIVDVGAGEGELLEFLSSSDPETRFDLVGVERSDVRRKAAAARAPRARFFSGVDDLPEGIVGLVVAYELFDALPVRAFRVDGSGALVERLVGLSNGGFVFVDGPRSSETAETAETAETLKRRGVALEEGQLLEVRPEAASIARALARRLARGILAIFDYGAPARALYGPARRNGTLEAFQAHRVHRDVLSDPGSRDITAWVDFSEIEEALRDEGLEIAGLVSQSRFLLASGLANELAVDPEAPRNAAREVERNAVAKLVAPGGMGESLRVLVASRETRTALPLVEFPDPLARPGTVPSDV
ncbi:MAG TPA: SAM-dependent methyltransferase [Thermoanaerobaculia bacterium]|nr:SAM-dependent methyltransferase [Thermoanaerobaculia bacterium]